MSIGRSAQGGKEGIAFKTCLGWLALHVDQALVPEVPETSGLGFWQQVLRTLRALFWGLSPLASLSVNFARDEIGDDDVVLGFQLPLA
jgi:hypothetical protein